MNESTEWNEHRLKLSEYLNTRDINSFLKWDVVKYTMFVGNSPYVAKELYYLLTHNWKKWQPAIRENGFGAPTPFILYPWSSGNLIHNAYHLARFEEFLGFGVEDFDCIFEFGGGYGSMARLFHNLVYKGKYIIYDIPEFSRLQMVYLDRIGMDNFDLICNLKDIPDLPENTLFLSTWALSEAPIELRNDIISKVPAAGYLIAYQSRFGDYNNIDYFNGIKKMFYVHENPEIKHLKNNYYLFGV